MTWKVPADFHCNNCIQEMGSSLCRRNPETGKPCDYLIQLREMAKAGKLEKM